MSEARVARNLVSGRVGPGLLQREPAEQLGVDPMSIDYWETSRKINKLSNRLVVLQFRM